MYPIIKLQVKTIKLICFFNFPCLRSNFPVTLGYLKPDSENPAQEFWQPWVLKTRGLTSAGSYVQGFIQPGVRTFLVKTPDGKTLVVRTLLVKTPGRKTPGCKNLMLHDDKTEFLIIGTRQQLSKVSIQSIKIRQTEVSPVASALQRLVAAISIIYTIYVILG